MLFFKHLFFSLTLPLFVAPLGLSQDKEESLVDRLILKVDKQSYAQSYIESYIQLKHLYLNAKYKTNHQFEPSGNWTIYLEEFLDDKIIYNESLLNSNQLVSTKTVNDAITTIKKADNGYLKKIGFNISSDYHKKILRGMLKVESFILSRNGLRSKDTFRKGDWFNKLKTSHNYRYFNNSKRFVPINSAEK